MRGNKRDQLMHEERKSLEQNRSAESRVRKATRKGKGKAEAIARAIQRSPAGKKAAEALAAKRGGTRKKGKRTTRRPGPGPRRDWGEEVSRFTQSSRPRSRSKAGASPPGVLPRRRWLAERRGWLLVRGHRLGRHRRRVSRFGGSHVEGDVEQTQNRSHCRDRSRFLALFDIHKDAPFGTSCGWKRPRLIPERRASWMMLKDFGRNGNRFCRTFRGVFTLGGWARFAQWVTGTVLCPEEHTITQILTGLGLEAQWRNVEHFAEYGAWDREAVERQLMRLVEQEHPARWGGYHPVAIDDTKEHRTSADVWGTCTFHESAARSPNRATTVRAQLGRPGRSAPGKPWTYMPLASRLYFRKSQLPAGERFRTKTAWRWRCSARSMRNRQPRFWPHLTGLMRWKPSSSRA